jgi:hypothetical protein
MDGLSRTLRCDPQVLVGMSEHDIDKLIQDKPYRVCNLPYWRRPLARRIEVTFPYTGRPRRGIWHMRYSKTFVQPAQYLLQWLLQVG